MKTPWVNKWVDLSRDQSGGLIIALALWLVVFVGVLFFGVNIGDHYDKKMALQYDCDRAVLAAVRRNGELSDTKVRQIAEQHFIASLDRQKISRGVNDTVSTAYTAGRLSLHATLGRAALIGRNLPYRNFKTSLKVDCEAEFPNNDIDLVFLVDRSASMLDTTPGHGNNKITEAKTALDGLLDIVADAVGYGHISIGVISFGDNVTLEKTLTSVAGGSDITSLKATIDAIVADGGTNTRAGLVKAHDEITANGTYGRRRQIVMATDGEPTGGAINASSLPGPLDNTCKETRWPWADMWAATDAADSIRMDGIELTVLGLGEWVDSRDFSAYSEFTGDVYQAAIYGDIEDAQWWAVKNKLNRNTDQVGKKGEFYWDCCYRKNDGGGNLGLSPITPKVNNGIIPSYAAYLTALNPVEWITMPNPNRLMQRWTLDRGLAIQDIANDSKCMRDPQALVEAGSSRGQTFLTIDATTMKKLFYPSINRVHLTK